MKKVIKLNETQLITIINRVVKEQEEKRYMFFSNLEQIKKQVEELLTLNEDEVTEILENGHDWAQDHLATAKESIDQVYEFLTKESEDEVMLENKKTKLEKQTK